MILRVTLAVAYLLEWPTMPEDKDDDPDKKGYPGSPGSGFLAWG